MTDSTTTTAANVMQQDKTANLATDHRGASRRGIRGFKLQTPALEFMLSRLKISDVVRRFMQSHTWRLFCSSVIFDLLNILKIFLGEKMTKIMIKNENKWASTQGRITHSGPYTNARRGPLPSLPFLSLFLPSLPSLPLASLPSPSLRSRPFKSS